LNEEEEEKRREKRREEKKRKDKEKKRKEKRRKEEEKRREERREEKRREEKREEKRREEKKRRDFSKKFMEALHLTKRQLHLTKRQLQWSHNLGIGCFFPIPAWYFSQECLYRCSEPVGSKNGANQSSKDQSLRFALFLRFFELFRTF
jgi:hypothetical protein